ncbi:MAG: hypothetical protein AAF467_24680 [Actinomycetota bacterium]
MAYLPTTSNSLPRELVDPTDRSGAQMVIRPPSVLKQGPSILTDQEFHSVHLTISTAAAMGFGTLSVDASHDRRFSLIEWRRFMEKPRKDGAIEFWGVSVRYAVEYRASDLKGDFSITGLAASAELSNASISIDFSTRGIDSDKLVTPIPIRSTLNVETYAEMVEAMNRIREEVQGAPKQLIQPKLIGVKTRPQLLIESVQDPDLDRAISITYALTCIAQGTSGREARAEWKGDDAQLPLISEVYEVFGASKGKVSDFVMRQARDELAHYRLAKEWRGPGVIRVG